MIEINYSDIVTDELMQGAILNNEFPGFLEDYSVLHCLLRIHQPKSVFEIGTNMGTGTSIICNAVPEAKVYSLDLPAELTHISLKQGGDKVGKLCKFPFTQLRGNSIGFDYSPYPCDAAFIDGCHNYQHPLTETLEMIHNGTKLIVFHDANIQEVEEAIIDAFKLSETMGYNVYRVTGTRIAYGLKERLSDWDKEVKSDELLSRIDSMEKKLGITEEPSKPKRGRKKK